MVSSDAIRSYFLSELENSSVETKQVRVIWLNRWLKFVEDRPLSEWDKVPDYVKRTSLVIPIGTDNFFAIPMPFVPTAEELERINNPPPVGER
mgnify:CR=1 FL=1